MSFSYNRVILVARDGDAPQVRFASTGQTIATLSVATDRRVKAGATPTIDSHRVICWDRLVKGAVIYRTWEDQQRQQHTTTEIRARELVLLDLPPMTTQAHAPRDRTRAANNRAATATTRSDHCRRLTGRSYPSSPY